MLESNPYATVVQNLYAFTLFSLGDYDTLGTIQSPFAQIMAALVAGDRETSEAQLLHNCANQHHPPEALDLAREELRDSLNGLRAELESEQFDAFIRPKLLRPDHDAFKRLFARQIFLG